MTTLTRADAVGSNPYDSIKWALETHVGVQDHGEYNFAILQGNEDSPSQIDFWKTSEPTYTQPADYVWKP